VQRGCLRGHGGEGKVREQPAKGKEVGARGLPARAWWGKESEGAACKGEGSGGKGAACEGMVGKGK
jgi:hypothetical protein